MQTITDGVRAIVSAFPGQLVGVAAAGVGIVIASILVIRWITRPPPERAMLRRLERLLRDPRFLRRKLATLNKKVISPSPADLRSAIEKLGGVTETYNGVEYVRLPDHVPVRSVPRLKGQ